MYEGIFDTHAHYTDARYDEDRTALLEALPKEGVQKVLLVGVDVEDSLASAALAERYPYLKSAAGVHPENAEHLESGWEARLGDAAKKSEVIAIGETGLDYHTPGYDKRAQQEAFYAQLSLAKELNLPVILHIRDAMGDALAILKETRPEGVVHCFSGDKETAREVLNLGLYLGFGGVLTFPNARRLPQAAAYAPEERILFETDCPYLAPTPWRGQRCDSRMIVAVAERMAQIRHTTAQHLLDRARDNGETLFGWKAAGA